MSFITDLPPIEAVAFFASSALKYNPDIQDIRAAVRRGLSQAEAAYNEEGKTEQACQVKHMTVDYVVSQVTEKPSTAVSEDVGDSGSHYDSYVAAKQRRRNGLYN